MGGVGWGIATAFLLQLVACALYLGIRQNSSNKEKKAELLNEPFGSYSCCPTVQQCKTLPGICYNTIHLSDSFKSHAWAARGAARAAQHARSKSALQGQSLRSQMLTSYHHSLEAFWKPPCQAPPPQGQLWGILRCLTHAVCCLVQSLTVWVHRHHPGGSEAKLLPKNCLSNAVKLSKLAYQLRVSCVCCPSPAHTYMHRHTHKFSSNCWKMS